MGVNTGPDNALIDNFFDDLKYYPSLVLRYVYPPDSVIYFEGKNI